jgi:hypothetical protein
MEITRLLYIVCTVYFTYIIIITNAKCVKTKIETRRIKYIKYNYITNSDTTWNHGEVAWENSWEKENKELANEPLFIVEYFTNSTPNTCDQMIQNQNTLLYFFCAMAFSDFFASLLTALRSSSLIF